MVGKIKRGETAVKVERRAFHLVTGSIFPLMAIVLPLWLVVALAAVGVGASITLEVSRHKSESLNRWFIDHFSMLLKKSESSRWLGSTYLLMATLAAFLLFDKYVAILALLFLSVGDPLAALVGERYGRTRIRQKSVEGALAFLVSSALVGGLFVAGGVDLSLSLVLLGAACAALVELLPIPLDDNLTVPLISGSVMMALA